MRNVCLGVKVIFTTAKANHRIKCFEICYLFSQRKLQKQIIPLFSILEALFLAIWPHLKMSSLSQQLHFCQILFQNHDLESHFSRFTHTFRDQDLLSQWGFLLLFLVWMRRLKKTRWWFENSSNLSFIITLILLQHSLCWKLHIYLLVLECGLSKGALDDLNCFPNKQLANQLT